MERMSDVTPEYLRSVRHTLTVFPEVVVLPETVTDESDTVTTTGGSIETDTNFNCDKISLQKGSKGEDVKKLQTILKARGYYKRQIDGDFGIWTKKGVIKLQTAQGNSPDGWFGPKTCRKLQQTSTTSNNNTGTTEKKQANYVIRDFKQWPSISSDMEALSQDITLVTPYTQEKYSHLRQLQKTEYVMMLGQDVIKKHVGYINEIKINFEDDTQLIEISLVGYTVFLEQTIEITEDRTGKRSELLKWLVEQSGLKLSLNLEGLTDDTYTLRAQTKESSGGGTGLTNLSGSDCTGAMQTNQLSARSFDINECGGNTKIGNSSANYAVDTKGMSAKEAVMSIYNRFKYGPSLTSKKPYDDNRRCPTEMWNKDGKIFGNCADVSRLVKAMGEVHGLKVGIRHCPSHYYNLIEVNGKVYRFDCVFKSGTTGSDYGSENCNNLSMRGGPWSK